MEDYVVALVFSNLVLSKLFNIFVDYLKAEQGEICAAKIERYKDKKTGLFKDSNRTLFLIKRSLYDRAIDAGLNYEIPNFDFKIVEYKLNAKSFPMVGYSKNFYITLPEFLKTEEAEIIIKEKLRNFINFKLLEENDYSLLIPLASRITGKHRNFAILNFSDKVSINTRAIIKLMLHNSSIFVPITQNLQYLPVYWCKEYKEKVNELEIPKIIKILKR